MTLSRWLRTNGLGASAYRQANLLTDEVNQLFQAFATGLDAPTVWSPAVDLYEGKDLVTVIAELPGLKKEDINISFQDDHLLLSGDRKRVPAGLMGKGSESVHFQRSIGLPYKVNADAIKANYVDGVLTVDLPKAEEAKPKQIKIEFN